MNPDIIPASSEPRAELVSSTAVAQIVAAREGALGLVTMAADLMERAQRLMGQAEAILRARHRAAVEIARTPVWVHPLAIAVAMDDFSPSA